MNSPLHIAYVVKRYPRFSETFIVNEILAHEAAGRSVEIFSLYPPNDTHFQSTLSRVRAPVTYLTADGLRAPDLWSELLRTATVLPEFWRTLAMLRGTDAREVFQAARLARLARERGIGLLHAHFATTATSVAQAAARFARIPYTFTAHAKDIFHESASDSDLERKLSGAARVITVSDFNVRYLCDKFGPAAGQVSRLYNGLDLFRFNYESPRQRPRHIVAVGRLIEKKGFGILLEACAQLFRQGVPFTCELIGGGELESALHTRIRELGLGQQVRLTGPLPQSDVIERVRSAAVFAAPCVVGADGNVDGLPTVLLEAMALGTPCVATDVTGIPEIVQDERTGLQVAQHDASGLAAALIRLLDDADLRVDLSRQARDLIEREFDAHQNTAQQWRWFEQAVRRDSAAPADDPFQSQLEPLVA